MGDKWSISGFLEVRMWGEGRRCGGFVAWSLQATQWFYEMGDIWVKFCRRGNWSLERLKNKSSPSWKEDAPLVTRLLCTSLVCWGESRQAGILSSNTKGGCWNLQVSHATEHSLWKTAPGSRKSTSWEPQETGLGVLVLHTISWMNDPRPPTWPLLDSIKGGVGRGLLPHCHQVTENWRKSHLHSLPVDVCSHRRCREASIGHRDGACFGQVYVRLRDVQFSTGHLSRAEEYSLFHWF